MTTTHRGGYHRRRQDPGWLSLRNSALTSAELPSEGCTAYLQIKSISFQFSIGTIETEEKDISKKGVWAGTCTWRASGTALCSGVFWSRTWSCGWPRTAFHGDFWHWGLMHNVENSIIHQTNLPRSIIDLKFYSICFTSSKSEHFLTFHVRVHVFRLYSRTGPLYLWLDDKRALFPWQVHLMLQNKNIDNDGVACTAKTFHINHQTKILL